MKRLTSIVLLLCICLCACAQKEFSAVARFDKTVHDFGKISISEGSKACTFVLTNISESPVNIFAVMTTCGCTKVKWTRQEIAPGKTGTVEATFSNDEGEGIFDKTLKVYLSDIKKPMILHIKGESVK